MATNPDLAVKAVEVTSAQLDTLAGGGSLTSGNDTYTANTATLYLTEDTSVSYESQTLTTEQKTQARTNIGAGTSNFSGSYNDLTDKPAGSTIETYTITTWTSLSSSEPYTYQATTTATATIGNDTIVELINDQAVAFATYGFAIGSVSGQNITIYSIGQPSSSITLKVKIGG